MTSEPESFAFELLAQLPLGVMVWRLDDPADERSLRLLYANPAAARMTERDLDSFIGRPVFEVFPASELHRVQAYAEVCRTRERREFGEVIYGNAEIGRVALTVTAVPVLDRGVAHLLENLSALRRTEAEAKRLNFFLDSIIEQLPAMVFLKDATSLRFERFNRAGEDLLGLSRRQMIGKSDHDFFPPEQADFFVAKDRQVLDRQTLEDIPEEPIDTPRGTRWLHTRKIPILGEDGVPQYLLGVSIDITEQKRAEGLLRASHQELEQRVAERTAELEREIDERVRAERALAQTAEELRQAQRLEAIGRLAGGVAHDFNNMLSVVLGYCDSLMHQLGSEDPLRGEVEQIERAASKATALTQQLLAFSRQQVLRPRVIDLNGVLRDMQRLLPRLLREDIRLGVGLASELAPIKADPSQIESVIMNLVVNARDAMPEGGALRIETANVDLDAGYVSEHPGAQPGPHVLLAVTDTGHGMDRDTLSRAFEPFFTTKERGKGTGLGLSTVFGIVKQSGGSIQVDSEPGRGATFRVLFPVTREPVTEPETGPGDRGASAGGETVLLVEDDDSLRALLAGQLERLGYRALSCRSGSEALEHGRRERVDVLLTDVVMPDMGGRALAEAFGRLRPGTRVLFMSGYTDDEFVRHGTLEARVAFLQKPFTAHELAHRIRELLRSA